MPYRWTYLRKVDQNGSSGKSGDWPISLFRAALCAAEETIQGSPFASAWLQLFRAHLSDCKPDMLRWRGDLGSSSEVRRAYSGLYGRYFARALLADALGIIDFVPLKTNCTKFDEDVTVHRIAAGDIPDWIAWDPRGPGYVLCEAKGRLSGSLQGYVTGRPNCIDAGKAQFARVEVRASRNRKISTRNWIAVNRWSTDVRGGQAVSLLWDPPGNGESLSDDEASRHAAALRRHRIRAIARGLGDPEFTVRIRARGSEGESASLKTANTRESPFGPPKPPSVEPYDGCYQAAIVTRFGIRPISGENGLDQARATRERAFRTGEPAMIFGLAQEASKTAESGHAEWLSDNGIVSADGSALFDLKNVDIEAA